MMSSNTEHCFARRELTQIPQYSCLPRISGCVGDCPFPLCSVIMNISHEPGGDEVSQTIRRVSDHPMKTSFEATPSDAALRSEDGWVDMDVRWLLTRETVGAEHSVFGITVFPPGSKHDIHRHPNAEEFEYLVSGRAIARVGDADVELGPGEVVFVPKN